MAALVYSFRRNSHAPQCSYWVDAGALCWSGGGEKHRLDFTEIQEVRLIECYPRRRSALSNKRIWVAQFVGSGSATTVLSQYHLARDGNWQDRSADYYHFLNHLLGELRAANPNLVLIRRQHWQVRLGQAARRMLIQVGGWTLVWLVKACRPLPPVRLAVAAGAIARFVGPWSHGHRIAQANLAAAFPQRSATEIEPIISGMWDNFGRVCAEFVHIDRMLDYNSNEKSFDRIRLSRKTLEQARRLREAGGPRLYFTAHLANWELTAIVATAVHSESDLAVVYRPLELGAAANAIMIQRSKAIGTLISSEPGAAARIRDALERRMHVAMLVDEHFRDGLQVQFFGRPCWVNPTLARFARLFDCPVHGLRAIRLPKNQLTAEVTDALDLPRDADGKVNVGGTMQLVTATVESWIREHPEQWIWMRRRWR